MVVVVEAWCGNGGQIEYECDRVCRGVECNETKVEAGEGEYRHVYNEGSVVIPATCVDYGVYTCVTCLATVDAYADGEIGLPTGVHVYDVYNSTVNPTCAAEGYDIFGCSAGECGTTEFREYTQRVAHTLGEVSQFGTVTCQICNKSYVDVTAEKAEGADKMCFGCGNDPCTCETSADWEGYIEPKEPFAIAANSEFVVTEIEWTSGKQPLAIGNGILIFKSQANATYTVSVYEQDGGEVLYTFTVTGTYAIVDLYQYPTVGKVVITATEDATVSIYSVVE